MVKRSKCLVPTERSRYKEYTCVIWKPCLFWFKSNSQGYVYSGQTDRQTNRQRDRVIPIYPQTSSARGYKYMLLIVLHESNPPVLGHRSQRLQWPIVITRCPASVRRPSSVRLPSSVKLFTFSTSSPEPLDGFWWNLVWMKYSRSLTSVVVFRPDPSRGGSRAGQK